MRIKSIRPAGNAPVYNMEVEGTHSFVLSNGVVAHNCYDELRYICMENPISAPPPRRRRVMVWDPLNQDPLHQRKPQELGQYDYWRIG